MAVTEASFTGNGSTTQYPFTFPYLKSTDVQVQVDATVTTAWTFANATTVQFNTAPSSGAKIKILRKTNVDNLTATFYAGSAIKSEDLNDNFTQNLYSTQETSNRAFEATGGTLTGDLTLGEDVTLTFEGATDNAHETTLTVVDPTADRTITLPNVTGTIVTTGDTGTVTSAMIADGTIVAGDIAANAVTASELADNAVDTAAIAADAVTGAKIADDSINSEHYIDGSIDTAHIADLQVTTAKIAADAITSAKIADNAIDSEHYAADSIDAEHYAAGSVDATALASNAVTQAKVADDAIGPDELASSAVVTASIVDNAVTLAKMADSSVGTSELVDSAVTAVKLATDAVTNAKVADSAIGTTELATNAVTTAKITDANVTTGKIADGGVTTAKLAADAVTGAKIADNAIGAEHIAANAVTTSEIADAELTTLAGMQAGTASILAGGTALTATLAEINTVVDGKSVETTISDTDAAYPTSGAVVDYVAAQITPLGGLEVIATEVAFPNTQPASGVVISISDAGGVVFNGSGVSTTGRTVGGSTVTINGAPSSLYSETLAAGVGLMISSTGSSQTYNYHKILGKEDDIKQLSDDINDFAARYRVASSAPSSSLDNGDLWYDTANAKMMVYSSTNSAWEEVTSTGDFYINTISSYSGTGGNNATFNGSAYRFVLSNPPSSAQQLIVSINGVLQKPNSGTGQPSEGFALNGSSIVFSAAPATGADYFIITVGSTVAIGTPSDNTVSTAKIQNLAVTTAKIAADAVDGTKIADDAVGAEHIEVLDANLQLADNAKIQVGTGNDLEIFHNGSYTYIDNTGPGDFYIRGNGTDTLNIRAKPDEYSIECNPNGNVELFYDNSKKFETLSTGVSVTGKLEASTYIRGNDNVKVQLGTANDLQIYHDGSTNIIEGLDGLISIRPKTGENGVLLRNNTSVDLFYDDVKKAETTSGGFSVTGELRATSDLVMNSADGQRIYLGAGNDLQIYHNGSVNLIQGANSSNIYVQADDFAVLNQAGNKTAIWCNSGTSVDLFYNNSKKFETTSAGVQVTGTSLHSDNIKLTADNAALWFGAGDDLGIYHDGTINRIRSNVQTVIEKTDSEDLATFVPDGAVSLFYDGSKKFETISTGAKVHGANLQLVNTASSGDAQLFLQAGEGAAAYITLYADDGDNESDKWKINVPNGGPLAIQYNDGSWENALTANKDGAVELYYDNSKKFETKSDGININGSSFKSGSTFHSNSNSSIFFNSSSGGYGGHIGLGIAGGNNYHITGSQTGDFVLASSYGKRILFGLTTNTSGAPTIKMTMEAGGLISGNFNDTSDANLKENINPIPDNAITDIKQLKPVTFDWKDSGADNNVSGFIAQEIKEVLPNLVNGKEWSEEDQSSKYTINTIGVVAHLTKALQEAISEIETLKTKVAALEAG